MPDVLARRRFFALVVAIAWALPAVAADNDKSSGQDKSAIDQAVERNPKDPRAWVAHGEKQINANRPDQAIADFERDPQIISEAADRQSLRVRRFAGSAAMADIQSLQHEIETARAVLLDPRRRDAYDRDLCLSLFPRPIPRPGPPPAPHAAKVSSLPPDDRPAQASAANGDSLLQRAARRFKRALGGSSPRRNQTDKPSS